MECVLLMYRLLTPEVEHAGKGLKMTINQGSLTAVWVTCGTQYNGFRAVPRGRPARVAESSGECCDSIPLVQHYRPEGLRPQQLLHLTTGGVRFLNDTLKTGTE